VRRPGERHLRDGAVEDDAVAAEAVDGGRLDLLVAVAADAVRAQRVDGDEQDVRPGGWRFPWRRGLLREGAGGGEIPGGAALIFRIELIDVLPGPGSVGNG